MSTAAVKITFDTHAYVRTLKNAGFSETQAEALSDGLVVAMTQGVATHDDIVALDAKINGLKTWLMVLTGLVAMTSPLAVHVLKAVGLFH